MVAQQHFPYGDGHNYVLLVSTNPIAAEDVCVFLSSLKPCYVKHLGFSSERERERERDSQDCQRASLKF